MPSKGKPGEQELIVPSPKCPHPATLFILLDFCFAPLGFY